MAKKKDEVLKVEVGAPVEQSETASAVTEVVHESEDLKVERVQQTKPLVFDKEVENALKQVAELKAQVEQLQQRQVELTDEQKKALQFCLHWVADIRRRSRNVQFRQEAQEAMTILSKLL